MAFPIASPATAYRPMLRNLADPIRMALDLATGRYPSFVYGRPLRDDEIPVFSFHGAAPAPFEALLSFLRDNGYRTVTAEQFRRVLRGERRSEREVLLTFDDGMGTIWSVVYPLLRKYGLTGTVFLIPGKIGERSVYRPSLDDVERGSATIEEVAARDASPEPLATWAEIEEMHASGVVDFQCHTLHHSLVFTSPRIVDFVNPEALDRYHPLEFSVLLRDGPRDGFRPPPFGTPLYASGPAMAARDRYLEDPGLTRVCVDFVRDNGGPAFFDDPGWRGRLRARAAAHRKERGERGGRESPEDRARRIRDELLIAKEVLESRLADKRIEDLCYPWGIGSELSVAVSREVGYQSNFWNRGPDGYRNPPGRDPFRISRIGEDFGALLPGSGRSSLASVLSRKLRRRAKQGSPYLTH